MGRSACILVADYKLVFPFYRLCTILQQSTNVNAGQSINGLQQTASYGWEQLFKSIDNSVNFLLSVGAVYKNEVDAGWIGCGSWPGRGLELIAVEDY